jgi:hypothetical protein
MNRREAIKSAFGAAGAALTMRVGVLAGQVTATPAVAGDALYVNPSTGNDTNAGSRQSPVRTVAEAARRANSSTGSGALTIVLAEGIHAIGETTVLRPGARAFSRAERLTIRAEVLPDDPDWHIGRMPTLIHTMPLSNTWNGRPDPLGGAADGMLIETSHVTIQGLRVLGLPVIESPRPGIIKRLYGVSRLRRDLEDLEIAQCIFAGEDSTNPNHVSIIAHGNGINVHHCIFRGSKISVVFWTPGSTGHAMTNCLCHEVYGSGVWTAGIANDFVYRNNVITGCNYVWTAQGGASAQADAGGRRGQPPSAPPLIPMIEDKSVSYRVERSYLAGNRKLAGSGTGARLEYADIDASFLTFVDTTTVGQPVELERDSTKIDYLHPVAGSAAAKIGAGLFTTPRV